MEKTLLRVGEAADFLAVSRWTIYRWLEQGKLKGTKIGKGSTRVFRESLDRLIQQNRTDNGSRSSDPAVKPSSTPPAFTIHSSLLRRDHTRRPCAPGRP